MSLSSPTLGVGYCSLAEAREISGLQTTNDATDDEFLESIVAASLRFIADVTNERRNVVLKANTARTLFRTPDFFIADRNADSVVDENDIDVQFIKDDGSDGVTNTSPGTVSVVDAEFGVISTTTACPSDATPIANYRYYEQRLDLERAKRAVAYLAAHLVAGKAKGPGKITRADFKGISAKDEGKGPLARAAALAGMRSKYLAFYEAELRDISGLEGVVA